MFKDVDVDLNAFFTSAIVTQEIRNGTRDEDDIPEYLIRRCVIPARPRGELR